MTTFCWLPPDNESQGTCRLGAKYEIYKLMNDLAEQGIAGIMISSELEEVLGMSDRVMVMHEGKSAGTLGIAEATEERIMPLATGVANGNGSSDAGSGAVGSID